MTKAGRLAAIEELLRKRGWTQDCANQTTRDAVASSEPLQESLCFQALAEHILVQIHSSAWISNRAKNPSGDGHDIIKRLIDSGASPTDLAIFAGMMQRGYLTNLGCILDGARIYGTLVFLAKTFASVEDSEKPLTKIDELHESLGWVDLETEMSLSREAAQAGG